jgi:hypothetical protein
LAIRGWLKASLLVVGRLDLGSCGGDWDRGLWRHGGERLGPGIRWNRDLTVSVWRKFLSSFWMDDRTRVDIASWCMGRMTGVPRAQVYGCGSVLP